VSNDDGELKITARIQDGQNHSIHRTKPSRRNSSSDARWITEQGDLKLMERSTRERYWLKLIAYDECNKFINFLSTLISGTI